MTQTQVQLTLVKRQSYRSINLHSERWFRDAKDNLYVLSKTLDGIPPFYEAYGPFREDHTGHLPRLRVQGQEYWGSDWKWSAAEAALFDVVRNLPSPANTTPCSKEKHP